MRIRASILLLLAAFAAGGCASFPPWKDKEPDPDEKPEAKPEPPPKPVAAQPPAPKSVTPKTPGGAAEEQELKLAKLWSRVDELEEEQFRQKERIRVLEKGITLGLVPEELKGGPKAEGKEGKEGKDGKGDKAAKGRHHGSKAQEGEVASVDESPDVPDLPPAAKPEKAEGAGPAQIDHEKYQSALASAHDHYRAGRYGRAIVEYSEIAKQYGDQVEGGMPLYWVAMCWSNLKEYNTARQHLIDFLKDYAKSPWAPRAKLQLARVEWQLGMQETALQRLREIIQDHPYEDAAEMAKMELETLDKKL